jgi:putative transposase
LSGEWGVPEFTRAYVPGGTFFFTAVTFERRPLFRETNARRVLREAIKEARSRRPFEIVAAVLLPDHGHMIWTLPDGDTDYSTRWRQIKSTFTREWLAAGGHESGVSPGKRRKGARGVWHQRFWEHVVRDEEDLRRHVEYIFWNPVKHGHVRCVHEWPWSTFHAAVAAGCYDKTWGCSCGENLWVPPGFRDIEDAAGE